MADLGLIYKEQFQKQFLLFGSTLIESTYTSVEITEYNRQTSTVPPGTDIDYPNFFVLNDRKQLEDLSGVVVEVDETGFVFPALDLPVIPKNNDIITDDVGGTWLVNGVFQDNFKAMYIVKAARVNL